MFPVQKLPEKHSLRAEFIHVNANNCVNVVKICKASIYMYLPCAYTESEKIFRTVVQVEHWFEPGKPHGLKQNE